MTLALLGDPRTSQVATADRSASGDAVSPRRGRSVRGARRPTRSLRCTWNRASKQAVEFVVAWHFPNFRGAGSGQRARSGIRTRLGSTRPWRSPATWRQTSIGWPATRAQWVETWYDSTLPYWLLDRTMANTSTLATTTCYRFEDGRFWAWEGIGCCQGTCTHVWHYAQAPGRLFPEIERIERERVNFGIGQHDDGGIGMRTRLTGSNQHADDGQCGRILGVLREHQMSADDAFLRRLWPKVKKAIEFMIRRDGNADGMLEGAQPNTLDADWYGKISFISSLYLAMLKAGEAMATEMGDDAFAEQCRADRRARCNSRSEQTFNGEYFVQIEDPRHADQIGVGRRLLHRPGVRPDLGPLGRAGAAVRPRQAALGAAGTVEVQLRTGRRSVPQAIRARAAGTPRPATPG